MSGDGVLLATTFAAGVQMAQGFLQTKRSAEYHDTEVELTRKQHAEDLRLAKKIHEDDIRVAHRLHQLDIGKMMLQQKKEHLMGTYSQLESHFVQLDADLVNALKESERDMYDQRNQQLNTLILASTVMLAALTTLLIEGGQQLPLSSDRTFVMLFGLSCGLSFALQTLCIVLCIETLRLASSFMIRRAEKLNEDLKKGREDTKRTFDNLRELGTAQISDPMIPHTGDSYPDDRDINRMSWVVNDSNSVDGLEASPRIDTLWRNIEKKHYAIMKKRYAVNNAFAHKTNSFEVFWTQYCKLHNERAAMMFYLGSMLMLTGTICWAWLNFTVQYKSNTGAWMCLVPIALSIPVGMVYKIFINHREITARDEFMEREQRDVAEMCKVEEEDYDKEFYSTFRPIADEGDEPLLLSTSPASAMRLQKMHDEQEQRARYQQRQPNRPVFDFEEENAENKDEQRLYKVAGGDGYSTTEFQQQSYAGRLHPAANAAALQINTASGGTRGGGGGGGGREKSNKNSQSFAANVV